MRTKKDKIVDSTFLFLLSVVVVGLIIDIYIGKHTAKPETQPTEVPTIVETTVAIIEQEPTKQEETEPSVTLYDVPLDKDLQIHIIETAESYGIDPAIIFAMAKKETNFRPKAIGDSGKSYGLLQIQPKWHYSRMQKLGCTDLLDPFQNVTVGTDYLAELLKRYGSIDKALTAYNRGHYSGTVTKYAKTVMANAEELSDDTYVLHG